MQQYRKKDVKTREAYSLILGKETMQSDYDFHKVMLYATPHDLSLFKSPRKDIGITILLALKSLFNYTGKSGIYEFNKENFHAFQLGKPEKSKMVKIKIFSGKDEKLEILLVDKKHENKVDVSQEEINFIISSIKLSSEKAQENN